MGLTEPMRRELLWLATVCDDCGHIDEGCFNDRRELFDGDQRDLGMRYVNLQRLGYVDTVLRTWDGSVGYARITEEGRFAARDVLAEELESPRVPDCVRQSAVEAFVAGSVSGAAGAVLHFLGLM